MLENRLVEIVEKSTTAKQGHDLTDRRLAGRRRAGFWPGKEAFPRAAFYSYAYPERAGFRDRRATPGASFDTMLGEFILPYETVAQAPEPDVLLLDFLSTAYAATAEIGGWDRAALECPLRVPGRVRPI